ncbi:MAG: ACT domain-containing protein [Bacteroidetes bacterium]|uniref:ACT domain-containing protein n=1 Tax=Candidatus Enterocola intestinipullorum TaxID=2840783 RepID=A0A9D9EFM1_9BACT|nr:ACT domain-containing protein [Candidatus Enterocola intestinipullorum]
MITKQLSVFLENRTGRLNDVARILAKENINMSAFSVADNSDFGILRVITDKPEEARAVLKKEGFAVSLNDVIMLNLSNTPGSLWMILEVFAQKGIYIEYMYAFSEGATAVTVIRPSDMEKAVEVLAAKGMD